MKRTDVHAPSVIIPEDYEWVAFECMKIEGMGDVAAVLANRALIKAHMLKTGGNYSRHEHGGNCHICGAAAIYTVLFYHALTNSYIRTGGDCAEKLDMSFGDMNDFRNAVRVASGRAKGKRAAAEKWLEAGLGRAYEIAIESRNLTAIEWPATPVDDDNYERDCMTARHAERERTKRWEAGYKLGDMLATTEQYGTLSERMVEAVKRLAAKHDAYEQKVAERAAENALAADCPEGKRLEIVGTVLSMKTQESDFGMVTKMLVRHESGYKVWSTVPSAFLGRWDGEQLVGDVVKVGDLVTFVATIERSRDDAKFGFASRPTGKKIVAAQMEVAA